MQKMSSKERIKATIRHEKTDHLPMCFDGICHGVVTFVSEMYPDKYERASFFLELGLDTAVSITPPINSTANYTVKEWIETQKNEIYPILHKEYITKKGSLFQVVRRTEDYPGPIRLISDHNVSRSKQFLVEKEEDLEKLEQILVSPEGKELDDFMKDAKETKKFCDEKGLIMTGYLSGVGDSLIWFSGVENVLLASQDAPEFLKRYTAIVGKWNKRRMEIMLEGGVDHMIRRGWYESTDFWSPALYRELFFDFLKDEVETCHRANVTYDYCMNSGTMSLLEMFKELKFDIFSNFDPLLGNTDLVKIKETVGKEMALCGGVNNFLVLEKGTEAEVEAAVKDAVHKLASGGGYILAPGDSIYLSTDATTRRNFYKMIAVWKELRNG